VRCAWGPRDGMKRVRECVYGGELDLSTLVWTRGRDFPLGMLESRMKCPRCGSRRVIVMFEPPSMHRIARG
jgi:DNA-directed RNA polymerase subunit RPC12/RpoP